MDPQRFDRITFDLAASGTRRALVRRLAAVPVVGGLAILGGAASAMARKRRHGDDDGVGDPGCNIECCMN